MQDTVIAVVLVAVVVSFVVGLLMSIRGVFNQHAPQRSSAKVVVTNGRFELALPKVAGEVFFRFEIRGDTDSTYDLLVVGEVVDGEGASRAFATKTNRDSVIEGASGATCAGTTYAVTGSTGSIHLANVDERDQFVRGEVREHPEKLLIEGWVYVPSSA